MGLEGEQERLLEILLKKEGGSVGGGLAARNGSESSRGF